MAKINAISQAARQAIFEKSAGNLPYDPVTAGMSPEDIKKTLYSFVTDGENSVLAELDRVIREANRAFSQVGAGGSTGDGGSCDCVTPQIRINSKTGFWEVSYDEGYSWESLGVDAVGDDGADGADGVTPQLRINASTSYWEVSYDNGSSWQSLGVKATGEGSGGGEGVVDVPVEVIDLALGSSSDTFDLVQVNNYPRIYKARVLMLTQVNNCIDDIAAYYYINNLGSLLNTHGITLDRVSVSNNLLHSRASMYNSSFESPIPLPLGDEITFGQNATGYYIKPTIIGGVNTYQNSWVSDWYVELELDIVNRLLLINAFQCDKKIGGN